MFKHGSQAEFDFHCRVLTRLPNFQHFLHKFHHDSYDDDRRIHISLHQLSIQQSCSYQRVICVTSHLSLLRVHRLYDRSTKSTLHWLQPCCFYYFGRDCVSRHSGRLDFISRFSQTKVKIHGSEAGL